MASREQDLFHHAGVGLDQRRLGEVIELQGNVLAQNAAQHFGHVADDFIHVQPPRLHDLAAAEGEQLLGQAGGPLGGLANLLGGPGTRSAQSSPGQQQ